MFTMKEKDLYLTGEKIFKKKGMETNPFIGKIVSIDWETTHDSIGGIQTKEEVPASLKDWANQEKFIITDIRNWGLSSTVTLDHRLTLSIFKVYNPDTGAYLSHFQDIRAELIYPKYQSKQEGEI